MKCRKLKPGHANDASLVIEILPFCKYHCSDWFRKGSSMKAKIMRWKTVGEWDVSTFRLLTNYKEKMSFYSGDILSTWMYLQSNNEDMMHRSKLRDILLGMDFAKALTEFKKAGKSESVLAEADYRDATTKSSAGPLGWWRGKAGKDIIRTIGEIWLWTRYSIIMMLIFLSMIIVFWLFKIISLYPCSLYLGYVGYLEWYLILFSIHYQMVQREKRKNEAHACM